MNASALPFRSAQGDGAGGDPADRGRGHRLSGPTGLHYVVGPFETTLEGDLEDFWISSNSAAASCGGRPQRE